MRRIVHGWMIGALLTALGCARGGAGGMSDSTFVATMAELRRVQSDPTLDSARRADARRAVLQGRGLTAEALERAARALADDPERAALVLQAIDRKMATLPADSAPRAP